MKISGSLVAGVLTSTAILVVGCAHTPVTPVEFAAFVELGEIDSEAFPTAHESVLVDDRGFVVVRSSRQYASLYLETDWLERTPFEDERAGGVVAARSRLIVRGQRRSTGAYEAVLEGENEIRTDSVRNWHGAPVSHSFRAWIAGIADQLCEEARR